MVQGAGNHGYLHLTRPGFSQVQLCELVFARRLFKYPRLDSPTLRSLGRRRKSGPTKIGHDRVFTDLGQLFVV